jgi:hypothetical protein
MLLTQSDHLQDPQSPLSIRVLPTPRFQPAAAKCPVSHKCVRGWLAHPHPIISTSHCPAATSAAAAQRPGRTSREPQHEGQLSQPFTEINRQVASTSRLSSFPTALGRTMEKAKRRRHSTAAESSLCRGYTWWPTAYAQERSSL